MPSALASAVPVNTDHGAASPQPTMPASVVSLTMTPPIARSMSPTPCRRFILSGQLTRPTSSPVILRSLIAASAPDLHRRDQHAKRGEHARHDDPAGARV